VSRFSPTIPAVFLLAGFAFFSTAEAAPEKRALLIGIQSYGRLGAEWSDLDGPINDVRLLQSILLQSFGFEQRHVRALLDEEATGRRIREAFERLIRETAPGDVVYVHYCGHGSTVQDANGDEPPNRKDSTLVPIDGRSEGAFEILDDEIALWMDQLSRKTPHVLLVVDACHSGSITRGAIQTRGAPTSDTRDYAWSKSLQPLLEKLESSDSKRSRFIRVSSCLDHQLASEYEAADGGVYGLFTWHWCQALQKSLPGETYDEVFQRAEAMVFAACYEQQSPRFEGDLGGLLFAGAFEERLPQVAVVSVKGESVTFRGGLLDGVTVGSIYGRAETPGRAPLKARILSAGPLESTGVLVEPKHPGPSVGDVLSEVEHAYPFPALKVSISVGGSRCLGEKLARINGVRLDGEHPDITIAPIGTDGGGRGIRPIQGGDACCRIVDATGQIFGGGLFEPKVLTVVGASSDLACDLVVSKIRKLLWLQTLRSYSREYLGRDDKITVDLVRMEPASKSSPEQGRLHSSADRAYRPQVAARSQSVTTRIELPESSIVTVQVRNNSPGDRYVYFINLDPAGRVRPIFPAGQDDVARLKPSETRLFDRRTELSRLVDVGYLDTYVCFVTDRPGRFVELESLEGLGKEPLGPTRGKDQDKDLNHLKQILSGVGNAVTRGASAAPASLTTAEFIIKVTPRGS
jgi:hypothetical protein